MSIIEQASERRKALSGPIGVPIRLPARRFPETDHQAGSQRRVVIPDVALGHMPDPPVVSGMRARMEDFEMPAEKAQGAFEVRGRASQTTVKLDLERLQDSGYVVPGSTRSAMAEQFGQIKRPLLTNARSAESLANRLSLIMVTSALPREGKTFCAINLAISMAFEIDTSVLLVDADVMRPEVLQRLGIHAERGLLDLLTDRQLRLSDVVLKTNVPKLSILPAGMPNNISSELLASDAMENLLLSLATSDSNQVVIFDTPPLLVTTEAKVLAARMGQVVLVVAASSTPCSALVEAFATVEQCPVVMSVLNKARVPAIPLGYGY